jgi:nucleoside phosphorylase
VQQALQRAAETVTGESRDELKARLRTGTVITTDDRNWELRYTTSAVLFNQSRAVAIDMESATIAAQGYRFRVPYGTLLCLSDKPLHGEIKLPGRRTGSTSARSASTSRSASPRPNCCAVKATGCTPASCAPSTNPRSAEQRR